jgi:hypothetical protein
MQKIVLRLRKDVGWPIEFILFKHSLHPFDLRERESFSTRQDGQKLIRCDCGDRCGTNCACGRAGYGPGLSSRPRGAIATASPYAEQGRSFVDLERGIFYRKAIGKRATKKRQTPAPVPPRLLVHLRRWKERKLIANCFVEFNGKPVASVKKGFRTAVSLAKLPGRVTPHTLRYTAAPWLMQRGCADLGAAEFLGMSPEDTCGHHHPDYLKGAAAAIGADDTFRWLKRWLT